MVEYCGKEYPHLEPVRFDWEYRPLTIEVESQIESGEVTGIADTLTIADLKRHCGTMTDNQKLILLCPQCLRLNGRKW